MAQMMLEALHNRLSSHQNQTHKIKIKKEREPGSMYMNTISGEQPTKSVRTKNGRTESANISSIKTADNVSDASSDHQSKSESSRRLRTSTVPTWLQIAIATLSESTPRFCAFAPLDFCEDLTSHSGAISQYKRVHTYERRKKRTCQKQQRIFL
jgi:hypothetical protein